MSVTDAVVLVQEYPMHLGWFVPELLKELEKLQIQKDLNLAHIYLLVNSAINSKKGGEVYYRWRKKNVERIEELDESKLNVFERLRRRRGKKTNTVFDKLKYLKGRG